VRRYVTLWGTGFGFLVTLTVTAVTFVITAFRKASFASAVYAMANPSVRLSVHHTPVLCQNEGMQRDAVFTIG